MSVSGLRPAGAVRRAGCALAPGATLAIILYFAHAGSVLLRLPVSRV